MSKKKALEQLIEQNNGYLITSMATESCGVSRAFLSRFVKERNLEKVARGVYITEDVWPDELFILQVRSKAVIFCGETALYLHGLIDREYSDICITVPTGYNVSHLNGDDLRVKYVPRDIYDMGVCDVVSASGNMVKVYDKERCICELIMDRKKVEVQNFQTAVREYMQGKDKKLSRLIEYAERLGIRDEVMKYVEVLV